MNSISSTITAINSSSGQRSSIKNLDAGTSLMIAANIKKATSRRRGSNCSSNAGKHGLPTPNEAFYISLKLNTFGLGQINSGAFAVFSADLSASNLVL